MRTALLIITLALGLSLIGCASLSNTYVMTSGKLLILKDNPTVTDCTQYNNKGQVSKKLSLRKNDTINYSGRLETFKIGKGPVYFYRIEDKSKYYYINENNGICTDRHIKKKLSLWAKFPKEQESEIWTLAINFVMNNSELKIHTQTDVILQTFNPFKAGQRGWTLNKIITGNQVEIIAHCSVYYDYSGGGNLQVERLYYYLNTGRVEKPNFFIY